MDQIRIFTKIYAKKYPTRYTNRYVNFICQIKTIIYSSKKKFYIETYGCQMNFADSEIVNAILLEKGMNPVTEAELADIILVNTCSIRENAETKVWNRLKEFRGLKAQNKR